MRRALLATVAAAGLFVCAGVTAVYAKPDTAVLAVTPDKASNFRLTDTSRLSHELYYFKYAPAIVIMSQTNGSKVSRDTAAALEKIQAAYKDQGVLFYMVNSNRDQTREQAAAEAKSQKFQIPLLMDELQFVGENLGVVRDGEIFVLNPKAGFKVAYHGPVDDRFAKSNPNIKAAVKDGYVSKALDAILAGKPVVSARVEVKAGKSISFPERGKNVEHAKISYSEEIAPILQAKCVTCHQKGGIGPFVMNSYDVVKTFAPMIRESLVTDRMPPWDADPHIGKFWNDFSLSAEQSKKLVNWIDAGSPRGVGEDILQTQAGEASPWPDSLGKPDVIMDLPSYDVPASGVVDYQYLDLDNPFKEPVWLRAVAYKPGARAVLHHATANVKGSGPSGVGGAFLGSYVPGGGVQIFPKDTGIQVLPGGKFTYQLHYTTTGKAQTDKTQVGFYVMDKPPTTIRRFADIADFSLNIPAGEQRHKEIAYVEFPADAVLHTLHPHAHFRGYSFELKAKGPDGKEEVLLSMPKYDFNWQLDFELAKPITIKAGTKLIVTTIYDNSVHNFANPDPKIDVKWGEQTWEEMLYFRVSFNWVDESRTNVRDDLQTKLRQSTMVGALDDNANGKVEYDELRGPMESYKARFAQLDTNKDNGLDVAEMVAAGGARASAAKDGDPF